MSLLPSPLPFISSITISGRLPPRRRSTLTLSPTWKLRLRSSISLSFLSLHTNCKNLFCCSSSVTSPDDSSSTPDQHSLIYSGAYWLSKSLIAWNVNISDGSCFLCASRGANLVVTADGIEGTDVKVKLEKDDAGLPANVIEKFPHIRDYRALKVPQSFDFKNLLKSQLAVSFFDSEGKFSNATGVQLPGILDELFSYIGPLGAVFSKVDVSLYLWAPTAQTVIVHIYDEPSAGDSLEVVHLEEENGVWTTKGPKSWEGLYFAYEVCVYHPSTLKIEKCYVNDPYARGLSLDGRRTLLVDLDSDALKPECWDNLAEEKPVLHTFTDISIYELHVRDFSASDETVHPDFRGGYLAFTSQGSNGVLHLKKLSEAGITHVHLLPTFQFAGVEDEKEKWKVADNRILEAFPSDSPEQQALISSIADEDGYNWGYNPVLWGVPKGSYASNPNGPCRTIEFRKMVQALNRIGFRVVLDVVYNHLSGNGPFDENSVLDKIVPGYYVRRNAQGFIENSACANNTASEHFMVERLILDDLLCWAVHYKVDGFRFDIMGHLMKRTMMKAKTTLHNLSMEKNGVYGSDIYIYGEGWDFGEVAKNGRGLNASQTNLYGTEIGSFNDRIRDAVLGGSPFGHPLQQGFVTGLFLQSNGHDHGSKAVAEQELATLKDRIQIGMAANLRDFWIINCEGKKVRGSEVLTYDNESVAYASYPSETVNYVSCHDNETLFDIVNLKTPMELSIDDRRRINYLASSIIALSQGVPFFHAGDEMLRSKSLDCDSYNSGDWFNRLDFSFKSNNWGVGLPPKEKNEKNWPLIKPILADPSFKPEASEILAAVELFLDLIRIRYSSPLFRLENAKSIQERVWFHNTGPSSVPGIIVMSIEDGHEGVPGLTQLDPIYSYMVIIINVGPNQIVFATTELQTRNLQLHPIQLASSDKLVKKSRYDVESGSFTVPPRTTSVFVEPRNI